MLVEEPPHPTSTAWGIVVHRIDAWSPLAPHRPDLFTPSVGLPAVSPCTAPLPHIHSALPKAHNVAALIGKDKEGTESDQPIAFRERSGWGEGLGGFWGDELMSLEVKIGNREGDSWG